MKALLLAAAPFALWAASAQVLYVGPGYTALTPPAYGLVIATPE